ncbi:MAG: Crp/Fnr family transcriptional regulator [Polyangiales bacterium]
MKMSAELEILRQCGWAQGLEAKEFSKLSALANRVEAREGRFLFRAGENVPAVYVVARGSVELGRTDESGRKHIFRVCGPGASFAEAAAIGDFPAPVDALVLESSTLVSIDAEGFRGLVRSDHAFCRSVLQSIVGRVHFLMDYLDDLVFRDAAGRVAKYLVSESNNEDALLTLSKTQLALHLNLRGETLSRVLTKFAREGLLEREGNSLRIVSLEGLRQQI